MSKRALGFMNRGSAAIAYNTYIGGVSATISTDALLATKLGISVGRIENFTIDGADIKCMITGGSYAIPAGAFLFNTTPCTYYIDSDYLVSSLGGKAFYSTNIAGKVNFENAISVSDAFEGTPLLTEILLKNCTSIGNNGFAQSTNGTRTLKTCYIQNVTSLGSTSGANGIFTGNCAGLKVYANPILSTNNGGAPDGDLSYVTSNGGTVAYVTNFTAPSAISNLSSTAIYKNSVKLSFTPPSSTNTIDYYEIYADGVFKNNIKKSGDYVYGLSPYTNYNITAIAVDVFYNKSLPSNVLNITTNTTEFIPFQYLKAYYKLDETSGSVAIDYFNSEDLTNTGITINQTGKLGTSYLSTGASQKLQKTNCVPILGNFSINLWVYRTANSDAYGMLIEHGSHNTNSGFGIWINASNQMTWRINTNFNNYSSLLTLPLNTWTMVTMTYDGANVKIYMDSVLKTTSVNTINPNSSPNRTFFNTIGGGMFFGKIDESSIYNTALTQTEIDAHYNAGAGITL